MALLHIILAMLFSECLGDTYLELDHSSDVMLGDNAYMFRGANLIAPSQVVNDSWTAEDIPLSQLKGPGVVLDIREKAVNVSSAELTMDDITSWTEANGTLPDGAVVFILTGWGLKDHSLQSDPPERFSVPGISLDAAKYLTEFKGDSGLGVVGVGLDSLFDAQVELLENNIYCLEGVSKLERLPATGFYVTVKPLKAPRGIVPTKIIARIPGADDDASTSIPVADVDASTSLPVADVDASTSLPVADVDASTSLPVAEINASAHGAVTYLAPVLLVLIVVVHIITM